MTPKLSIGLIVFNGEKFIANAITSLLNQTFNDFELFISDNASTDSTQKICKEFAKNDKRIIYFRQLENHGADWNFRFVLNKASGEYFMWAAADDIWDSTFVEKNIFNLKSNKNLVCSISEVDFFGPFKHRYDDPNKIIKYRHVHPITGNYLEKIKFYLKFKRATMMYGIFRTQILKKNPVFEFPPQDLLVILNVLKYGDLGVVDQFLMHRFSGGMSSIGMIHALKTLNVSNTKIIFMYLPFLKWSFRNLGLKFILKNFPSFLGLFYIGYGRIILDIFRVAKYRLKK